jgi:hypothetical protein
VSLTEEPLPFDAQPSPVADEPAPASPPIEVVRSRRRRKTVEARLVNGTIRLMVPAGMSKTEIDSYAAELGDRLIRRHRSEQIDLTDRARELAARYGLPPASHVEWSSRQTRTWASCTLETGLIRVSTRAASLPPWVVDYLLVHELAHLVHGDHSRSFWDLCNRYPRTERARGYLMAIDHHVEPETPEGDADPV